MIVIGTLELLAIHGIDRVVVQTGISRLTGRQLLEHHPVDGGIVARLEKAFLYTDADDAVGVEGAAKGLGPLLERQTLDAVLHGFYVLFRLHVVGNTFITWLVPGVILAMTFKPGLQGTLVG